MKDPDLELTAPVLRMIAEMGAGHVQRMVELLVGRRDVENLEKVVEAGLISPSVSDELKFALAPLAGAPVQGSQRLLAAWRSAAGITDTDSHTLRLIELAATPGLPGSATLHEIGGLLSIGADPAAPLGPSGRTAIGEALRCGHHAHLDLMLGSLAERPGAAVPASSRAGVIDYLVTYRYHAGDAPASVDIILRHFPELRDRFAEALSRSTCRRAEREMATEDQQWNVPVGYLGNYGPTLAGFVEYLRRGLLDREAIMKVWEAPVWGSSQRRFPFFSFFADRCAYRNDLAAGLAPLLAAGIDPNTRFDDVDLEYGRLHPLPERRNNVPMLEIAARCGSADLVLGLLASGRVADATVREVLDSPHAPPFKDPDVPAMLQAHLGRQAIRAELDRNGASFTGERQP